MITKTVHDLCAIATTYDIFRLTECSDYVYEDWSGVEIPSYIEQYLIEHGESKTVDEIERLFKIGFETAKEDNDGFIEKDWIEGLSRIQNVCNEYRNLNQ
jgi:hypothetical protein